MRMDVRIARQAMRVVLPTNQQIGPWQARAAHLLALAEKGRVIGRRDSGLAQEAAELLFAVRRHQQDLDERMRDLPGDVAASSRLEDTARALKSVESVLCKTLLALGVKSNSGADSEARERRPKRGGSPPLRPGREAR